MCGRTACTLAPDDIIRACKYNQPNGKSSKPFWIDPPGGQQYRTSYNVAPGAHTPVLLSTHTLGLKDKNLQESLNGMDDVCERVVMPMKWGLTPSWHQGNPYKVPYETNNCRAEGMLDKKTFKVPLQKGNRCVILADGFYEWKTTKEGKQPYFFYFPQGNNSQATPMKEECVKFENVKHECAESEPDNTKNTEASTFKHECVKSESAMVKTTEAKFVYEETELWVKSEESSDLKDKDYTSCEIMHNPCTDFKLSGCVKDLNDHNEAIFKMNMQMSAMGGKNNQEFSKICDNDSHSTSYSPCKSENVSNKLYKCSCHEANTRMSSGVLPTDQHVINKTSRPECKSCICVQDKAERKLQCTDRNSFHLDDVGDFGCSRRKHVQRLLTIAGVFDVWKENQAADPLFSYSVITVSSSSDMDWCHHRMPAILSNDEEVHQWLESSTIPLNTAVSLIKPKVCLSHHAVSKQVNNSRYQAEDCVKPATIGSITASPQNKLMKMWLQSASPSSKRKLEDSSTSLGHANKQLKKPLPKSHAPPKPSSKNIMLNWLKSDKNSQQL